MIQVRFLNVGKLVLIQSFPSLFIICLIKVKKIFPTIYSEQREIDMFLPFPKTLEQKKTSSSRVRIRIDKFIVFDKYCYAKHTYLYERNRKTK